MLGNLHWSNSSKFNMLLDVAFQCIWNTHQCSSFGIQTRVGDPSMSSIGTVARSEIGCYINKGASIKNGTAFVVYDLGCRGFGDFDSIVDSNSLALFSVCLQQNLFLNSVSASPFKAAACFKTRFWAFFEAEKAKYRTIGCRIVVAIKVVEPLAPLSLLF
jgi:hypothetical protein